MSPAPTESSLHLPPGYARIKVVSSFHELVTTPFGEGINGLCWQRSLEEAGELGLKLDFAEVVQQLGTSMGLSDGMATLDEERLRGLPLSAAGRAAVEVILEDLRLLHEQGLSPIADCIHGYPRDEEPGVVPTDVYSFHADSATAEADTYLCTYFGPSSEGIRNEDALQRVSVPETRAALLELFGGEEDEDFREHLRENCYDLHYAPLPGAQVFSFGLYNLWRIAVDYPGSPVPPFIHRAPETQAGDAPRLLLIS
jgi:hypothetical protein